MRRAFAQIFVRGVAKKPRVDETADGRESAFEGGAECREDVVAVDLQSGLWGQLVLSDLRDDLRGVAAEHSAAELHLQLKQHRCIRGYRPAPAHALLRPTGHPAPEDWCPIRSKSAG